MYISKSKRCYNVKPSAYCLYVKTKMTVDFHICISVPLRIYDLQFPPDIKELMPELQLEKVAPLNFTYMLIMKTTELHFFSNHNLITICLLISSWYSNLIAKLWKYFIPPSLTNISQRINFKRAAFFGT